MDDEDILARIKLSASLPANEGRLRKYLFGCSATECLNFILNFRPNQRWLELAIGRCRARLEHFDFARSVRSIEKLEISVIQPSTISNLAELGSQAPWAIYSMGQIPITKMNAVVGTRNSTPTGRAVTGQVLAEFDYSSCLVSGGAKGIDMHAHEVAKELSISQVMVLAGGLDRPYPQQAERFIRDGFAGAVISEMPPSVVSGKLGFLNRNRLIAALSSKLFLVEAPTISGSINTAQHALSLGRDVIVCLTDLPDFSPGGQWFAKKQGVLTRIFLQS